MLCSDSKKSAGQPFAGTYTLQSGSPAASVVLQNLVQSAGTYVATFTTSLVEILDTPTPVSQGDLMKHEFQTIRHALFRNLPLAYITAYRIVRSKIMGIHHIMFTLASSKTVKVDSVEISGYRIEHFLAWSDVSPSLRKELSYEKRSLGWDAEKVFERGGTLWIGRLHGQLVNAGWSRQGNMVSSWFFPLAPT